MVKKIKTKKKPQLTFKHVLCILSPCHVLSHLSFTVIPWSGYYYHHLGFTKEKLDFVKTKNLFYQKMSREWKWKPQPRRRYLLYVILVHLPMQETQVRSLVQEDPTCCGATKQVDHNYWACAPEPEGRNCWAHKLQLLKPQCPRVCAQPEKPQPESSPHPLHPREERAALKSQHSHKNKIWGKKKKKPTMRDLPGGPVVRTQCFHCWGLGLIPG